MLFSEGGGVEICSVLLAEWAWGLDLGFCDFFDLLSFCISHLYMNY